MAMASHRRHSDKPTALRTKRTSNAASVEEKGTNIQVVLRCRGRNEQEIAANSPVIVEPLPSRRREVLLKTTNKVYSFDRVFGQDATQEQIYNEVAQPILDQVLMGYNCTIFAYGQTGTGKTYTMEGDLEQRDGKYTARAGIIPRAIHKLFETLDAQKAEYSVKVSLIELYNEEIRDLLSGSNDDGRTLRIFEDHNGSGVIVQGMEEALIKDAAEAIRVMQEGSKNRSIAATRCNEKSSRSHCIFTLTVHIKETIPSGEEVLKVGKLNLVDLAGSENISRSGAEHVRAREAGMINQSLLTLGRVINQLVEHSPHVPYRESKLTRLLKDSLGGRTKTCIIATVSVAKMNQEEIISTLDYASRAKNIRNRPEANQRMNPKVLLREYEMTIERLKADLQATREQKGIYLSKQTYQLLTDENQSTKDRVNELSRDIEMLRETLQERTKELEEKTNLLAGKESELMQLHDNLRVLDEKLVKQITEYRERVEKHSTSAEEDIKEIVDALEHDTDVMGALVRDGIRAQKAFARKIDMIYERLREETRRKKQCAEQEASSFFSAFDTELDSILSKIRHIEEHFAKTYKNHIREEREYLESQNISLKRLRDRATDGLTEERENIKRQRAALQANLEKEIAKNKKAAQYIINAMNNLVTKFAKTAEESLQQTFGEVQTSFDKSVDSLETIRKEFEDTLRSTIDQNVARSAEVENAEQDISNNQEAFNEIRQHASTMQAHGETYYQKVTNNNAYDMDVFHVDTPDH